MSKDNGGPALESSWIAVTDRLPLFGQECLIRIIVGKHHEIEGAKYIGDGDWHGAWCNTHGANRTYKVRAWIPLHESLRDQKLLTNGLSTKRSIAVATMRAARIRARGLLLASCLLVILTECKIQSHWSARNDRP